MSQNSPPPSLDNPAIPAPTSLSAQSDTSQPDEAALKHPAWRNDMSPEAQVACIRGLAGGNSAQARKALLTYLRPDTPPLVLELLADILPAEVVAQGINVLTIPSVLRELQESRYGPPQKYRAYVRDLAPLATMRSLQKLYFTGTPLRDITRLAGLTDLRELSLDNTQAQDLSSLACLCQLQWLNLHNTRVNDLTPLAGLTELRWLHLDYTYVHDLTPLAGLNQLQSLSLVKTPISDLTPLAELHNLQILSLNQTDIRDFTPLAGLRGLQSLHIDNTPITNLTQLEGLRNLIALALHSTQVSDTEIQRFEILLRSRGQDIAVYSAERE